MNYLVRGIDMIRGVKRGQHTVNLNGYTSAYEVVGELPRRSR
jgi:hypothetical protein